MSESTQKPERKRKGKTVLPLETLAEAWALAQVEGFPKAAKAYDVHPETIRRASVKIAADETLRAIAASKRQELADEWRPQAMRVLRAGFEALEKLFTEAKPDQLRDVAGAVHLIAEKIIAVDAIPNVRRNLQTAREGQRVPAARGAGAGPSAGAGERAPPGPGASTDAGPVH